MAVMVWERGRPKEFGIHVPATSRIVNAENVLTYEPSKVPREVITEALTELRRQ